MSERPHIGLDNPVFGGRLRQSATPIFGRPPSPPRIRQAPKRMDVSVRDRQPIRDHRPARLANSLSLKQSPAQINTAVTSPTPALTGFQPVVLTQPLAVAAAPIPVVKAQPYAQPAQPKQQHSKVLRRHSLSQLKHKASAATTHGHHALSKPKRSKIQVALVAMACFVFATGLFTSLQTILTNHNANAQVSALSKKAYDASATSDSPPAGAPSTVKPTSASVANYVVGPNMPRYLNIPELGVHARVLSLGILSNGALGTPNNVFDTGWYNESSLPGQPGAMLIDGHVSSWTSHGVFYGIKNLKPGDTMQVQRGDGTLFTYKVVRSQTFSDNNVDMTSAVTPVTAGKPGLNLITCTGTLKPGTSEFNERVVVYAEQI
jgi:LPXTG-site transpeptidase (sortase) family protein